jgi:AcrR family transcriptional regulator
MSRETSPEPVSPVPSPTPVAKRPRGRPRKTDEERDDGNRRQELLAAAAKLFDIAAAVGMHSGSPFYHFKSKNALLYAVIEEGMHSAIARQKAALTQGTQTPAQPLHQMRLLIRAHFDTLLGPGNDFVPVMLYEHRSLLSRQRTQLAQLQVAYEAAWIPVLDALHASGQLRAPVKLSRLLILGALNWSVQWFDRKKEASVDDLTQACMALFFKEL